AATTQSRSSHALIAASLFANAARTVGHCICTAIFRHTAEAVNCRLQLLYCNYRSRPIPIPMGSRFGRTFARSEVSADDPRTLEPFDLLVGQPETGEDGIGVLPEPRNRPHRQFHIAEVHRRENPPHRSRLGLHFA